MLSFVHSALILIVQCFVSACIALRWLLASVLVLCGMCGQMEDRLRWSGNWVRLHWYPVSIQSCQLYSFFLFFFMGKNKTKHNKHIHSHTCTHTHTHTHKQNKNAFLWNLWRTPSKEAQVLFIEEIKKSQQVFCWFMVWQKGIQVIKIQLWMLPFWLSVWRAAAPCTLHHEAAFSCSSLVTTEPTWLHSGELKFKAKEDLITVDRTTVQNLWMEMCVGGVCLV